MPGMIWEMFAVVELQKIGGVHEGLVEGGGDESRGERAVFEERGKSYKSETAVLYVSRLCSTLDPLIRNQTPLHISQSLASRQAPFIPPRRYPSHLPVTTPSALSSDSSTTDYPLSPPWESPLCFLPKWVCDRVPFTRDLEAPF